jgi:AcrR family transcriptional regulator
MALGEVMDRRAERHQHTKREIVTAAWALCREQGLGGWALRDVATAVGMRAPSLYVYFESKHALYDAMFADGYRELLARIEATPVDDAEPPALMRTAARVFFDFCVEDPARHQLLFLRTIPGFAPSPDSYALATVALDRLTEVLGRAGVGDQASVDLWTAVLTGLAAQQVSNDPGGDRWARLLDRAVDAFLDQRS